VEVQPVLALAHDPARDALHFRVEARRSVIARLLSHRGVRTLFASRLFWAVLALKLALGSLAASYYMRDLFTPFLNYFVASGFANPWEHFAAQGRLNSFPYPPAMLWVLALPRALMHPFLAAGTDTVTPVHLFTMRLALVVGDLAIAIVLARWFPLRARRVLAYYWCSPFVIYICYWHGQLDVIPTALFLVALHLLRSRREAVAFVVLGVALATKSHLLVALPFLAVYAAQELGVRRAVRGLATSFAVYAAFVLPYVQSAAYRMMVYGSEEQRRAIAFQLPVDAAGTVVMVAPAALLILFFRFLAYPRRNWDLLMLYLGLTFGTFIVLAPPAPGYFLWSLPFLVHYICWSARVDVAPYAGYCVGYLAYYWLAPKSDLFDAWRSVFPAAASLAPPTSWLAVNLAYTVMQTSLAGLLISMYLFGVRRNAAYRMRTTPVVIGIAGDSGSGKDTLTKLFETVVPPGHVTAIAGDDYHRWPRGHQMWQVHTHLDVRANDLSRQHQHAVALSAGMPVLKGTYDHHTGTFTEEELVDPGQYIVFQGLHTLSLESLRGLIDLKVYLDPDEPLRLLWAVQRDCGERGADPAQVLARMEKRRPDRERYVAPQREMADLVLRYSALDPVDPLQATAEPRLSLEVRASTRFDLTALARGLAENPGLKVEHEPMVDPRWQVLTLGGTAGADAIARLAGAILPQVEEPKAPRAFAADVNGCVQLLLLVCLSHEEIL
jgi:uridine kinase